MQINVMIPFDGVQGGIRIIAGYCNHLAARGHTVHVLVGKTPRTRLGRWRKLAARLGISKSQSFFNWEIVKRIDVDFDDAGWRARVPDGDMLVGTWWGVVELAASLPSRHGQLVQLIQGDDRVLGNPADKVTGAWRIPSKRIAVSDWMANVVRQETGITEISVIRNAIDTSFFDAPVRAKTASPRIGYVFSPHACKGSEVAATVIERVRGEIRDLSVVSFGTIRRRSNGAALPRDAHFYYYPRQSLIPSIYASCDVWISTSRSEGSCLPPQEAMACRTPAVMTNVGDLGTPDIFKGGGFVVPVDDVEGLVSNALRVLRADPKDWSAMSQAAWQSIRNWSWDLATDEFEKVLTSQP